MISALYVVLAAILLIKHPVLVAKDDTLPRDGAPLLTN